MGCAVKNFSADLVRWALTPQTVLLLSHWHQNTHYHINCNGEDTPVSVGCGVRQGCRAAPLLWTGYMWLFLLELLKETSPNWVISCLNVYADDYQMGDVFHSQDDLQQLMHNITKTLQLLKRFGLLINPNKCTALLTLSGTCSRRTRAQLTAWREGKEWLRFSDEDNDTVWIPIASKATYLGAVMSYAKFEDQTVKHRVQLSRIAFTRLRKWLTGKRGLRKQQRLSLFTTCVYPIMTYGIFPIGLTTFGLKHIQLHMYSMLRQILCNHAYITGQSHQQALALNHVDPPLAWLLNSVDSLQESLNQRLANTDPSDIICLLDWSHLDTLRFQIDWHLQTGPEQPVQPSALDVPTAVHTCLQCPYATTDPAQSRRHCTIMHAQPMARSQPADQKQYMHHGLPQCKFCQQTFTSWRTFHMHIQRGCQVLIVGPPTCWLDPSLPLEADPARPPEMFAAKQDAPVRGTTLLTDSDLRNILNQEWGRRILTIVGNRSWHHMRKETAASTYLANRCCLCDQFLGRTQDLNRHYKLHHPEFWPHIQAKGIQLTTLYGEETPCAFCGALFKNCHQCPVWVQMAMMLIYGGGLQIDGTQTPLAQRCEICMEHFQTSEALHAHLVTEHRLPSNSFNAARDTLDGEPVCAHCLTMYDNVESLRSHISQGRCLSFNPELPTEVLEVRPQWIDALCHGKLADTLRDPHVRMQLSLHCQHCRCRYSRASDLSGHLQASHDKLWSMAQGLTGILVELLYNETGCLCNPNIGNFRPHHVCVPLRQLALLFMRLPDPLLYPHVPTEDELAQMFSRKLDREHRFLLERALTGGNIEALWKDPPIVDILRQNCVLCAAKLHPADLVIHMHEVHHCSQPLVRLLMHQLLTRYMSLQATDFQCYACEQVFNHPEDVVTHSAPDRTQTVQAHFRAQCPNLLQTAVILSKAAHGRHGRRRHERVPGDECTDLDSVPTHGTLPGQDSQVGTECGTAQKAKKRRTGPTDTPKDHGQQRKSGPRNVTAGKTGAQAGQGYAADEEGGHLHLLFRQQRARQLHQPAHADDRDLGPGTSAAPTGPAEDADAPPAPEADAGGLQHSADQAGPSGHGQGGLGPEDTGLADIGLAAGWNMPIPGMGCAGQTAEGESTQTTHAETPAPDLHRHAGSSERRSSGDEVPLPAHDQQQRSDAMEVAAEHASRPALATDATAMPLSHLADHGRLTEDAQPSTEPIGAPIAEDAGTDPAHNERTGEREDEIQRPDCEEGGTMTPMPDLTNHDMRHLLTHVAFLTLENPGNICFANAAVTTFMWTTLSLDPCDFNYWGKQRHQLTSFLLANYATHANLMEQDWFQDTLRCWGQQDPAVDSDDITQQDATEFLHVWLTQMATPAFDMRWERRYMENDRVCIVDSSGKYTPLWLHMDATTSTANSCDLTQLFSLWRQVDGMQAALTTAPVCLCLHIDRLTRDNTGRIHKSDCMINIDTPCIVPVFQGAGLTHEPVEYQPVALMAHLGQDQGGHYRAGLKLAPTLVDMTTPAEWLLTDDWVHPTPTWRIPSWMLRNTTVIWMVRTDCIRLHRYNLRQPLQDITAAYMPA